VETSHYGSYTRFIKEVGKFTDTTTLEDYEDRLHETLGLPTSLDDEINEHLDDSDLMRTYRNVKNTYESANRVILRTSRQMESHLPTSTANIAITNDGETAATVTPIAPSAAIRLPPLN
jgi:uncharacterized protein YycO